MVARDGRAERDRSRGIGWEVNGAVKSEGHGLVRVGMEWGLCGVGVGLPESVRHGEHILAYSDRSRFVPHID